MSSEINPILLYSFVKPENGSLNNSKGIIQKLKDHIYVFGIIIQLVHEVLADKKVIERIKNISNFTIKFPFFSLEK